jgi:folate-binding protein YgfZ
VNDAEGQARIVRAAAGLFTLADRAVLEVSGGDRVRWLNGMITNDVAALAPGTRASGCYAALLTPQGRIVTDLHVCVRSDELWLELPASRLAAALERLSKLIIADDVRLVDRSHELARLALEGPGARAVLADALGPHQASVLDGLAPDACADIHLAGAPAVVAAYGLTGEPGFQLFLPAAGSPREAAYDRLMTAGARHGLVVGGTEALELLRVESGLPIAGAELTEDVLPPEARLERAISYTKGCYTGQEIIARLRSRGQVAHLLVGIASEGPAPLRRGQAIHAGGEAIGEITSAVVSPIAGPIALGFVRRAHAEPGTAVTVEGRAAHVVALPFVRPRTPDGGTTG